MADADSAQMIVQVRLFAVLRERVGEDSLELRLPSQATVADALRALRERTSLSELLADLSLVMAVNREYAQESTVLTAGDELALIPPVSGGAGPVGQTAERGRLHVLISDQPLDPARATRTVADNAAGAIVLFQGVTREVAWLHYEAYPEMARERIELIAGDALRAHHLLGVAVEHRIGDVATGEPSVLVAVAAAHRAEAFNGARAIIDRLKDEAPIWKREHDGGAAGRWLSGTEVRP